MGVTNAARVQFSPVASPPAECNKRNSNPSRTVNADGVEHPVEKRKKRSGRDRQGAPTSGGGLMDSKERDWIERMNKATSDQEFRDLINELPDAPPTSSAERARGFSDTPQQMPALLQPPPTPRRSRMCMTQFLAINEERRAQGLPPNEWPYAG